MKSRGPEILTHARLNKGTAFTPEERDEHGLHGLLPPIISTMDQQLEHALSNVRRNISNIERYIFLSALHKRNERLYFRLLIEHIEELMPIVYTPTVGEACQEFARIFRETAGFYISLRNKGHIHELLGNWHEDKVRLIVVTDGERILGLGDLGTNGMGIPIGKLALYCACAGIHPEHCMPIVLDVGTENANFRDEDPMYLGLRQPRVRGKEYDEFIDEFVTAVKHRFPKALLQFEDFATPNAIRLLDKYHDELLCFNDDIQGTASVALAGLFAATRINGKKLSEMTFMFCGAGSAATGIGHLLTKALEIEGLTTEEARARLTFIDSKGLVTGCRDTLKPHVEVFATHYPPMNLAEAVKTVQPDALIGATGRPGIFTEEVISAMGEQKDNPIIFALSNPTSNAECTAEQAYEWTNGKAVFASGSPFGAVHIDGKIRVPGQGNNAYIFPGLGLGAIYGKVTRITDDLLIAAAHTLANNVSQNQIDTGCLYPSLKEIRPVSLKIAVAIAKCAEEHGLTSEPLPEDFEQLLEKEIYFPEY